MSIINEIVESFEPVTESKYESSGKAGLKAYLKYLEDINYHTEAELIDAIDGNMSVSKIEDIFKKYIQIRKSIT